MSVLSCEIVKEGRSDGILEFDLQRIVTSVLKNLEATFEHAEGPLNFMRTAEWW